MKRLPWLLLVLLLMVIVVRSAQATSSAELRLDRAMLSNGGGMASGGGYTLQGSFGQVFSGESGADGYQLSAGFLVPVEKTSRLYLPFVWQ